MSYSSMKKIELIELVRELESKLSAANKEMLAAKAENLELKQELQKLKANKPGASVRMSDGSMMPVSEYNKLREGAFRMMRKFRDTFGNTAYVSRVDGVTPQWRLAGKEYEDKWILIEEITFRNVDGGTNGELNNTSHQEAA